MTLLIIALAPVVTILIYIYFRDKYEKEPIGLLIKGFVAGAIIIIPCVFIETLIAALFPFNTPYLSALWNGFMVAGFTEELLKFAAVLLLFWNNRNFNEKFDGIVYAVFVSLGFAALENVMYVFSNGASVGIMRAFTAVPAHALFGIIMGSYIGLARFHPENKHGLRWQGFFYAWFFHGVYDFLLMTGNGLFVLIEIPFMFFLIRRAFRKMKKLSDESFFKGTPIL